MHCYLQINGPRLLSRKTNSYSILILKKTHPTQGSNFGIVISSGVDDALEVVAAGL